MCHLWNFIMQYIAIFMNKVIKSNFNKKRKEMERVGGVAQWQRMLSKGLSLFPYTNIEGLTATYNSDPGHLMVSSGLLRCYIHMPTPSSPPEN